MEEFDLGYDFYELTKEETTDEDWLPTSAIREEFDPETKKLLAQFKQCHTTPQPRGFFMYNIIIGQT